MSLNEKESRDLTPGETDITHNIILIEYQISNLETKYKQKDKD